MSEILLETNKGIIFEKVTIKNRCKVTVKNKDDGFCHMVYRFNKDVKPLSSKYISWENLNCCNGWAFDRSYLLAAVQKGKKLCAGILFDSEKEQKDYEAGIADNDDYVYYSKPPMTNGPHTTYYIDIARDGAISDFINTDEVLRVYDELGITNFNKKLVCDLITMPMWYMINGETFDYRQPCRSEEYIMIGLMLGYPLESTASLLEKHQFPATVYKEK